MDDTGEFVEPSDRLDELESTTRARADALERGFDGIVEAASDVATDDEHDPEGHTIAWERQQIAALLDSARSTLADIDTARRRLDDGEYGTCTGCGETISPERLDALPAADTCVACSP